MARNLSGFHRNTFRLESVSTQSVGPNRKVILNLPENSLLDSDSFQWVMEEVEATEQTVGTGVDLTALIPMAQDLIGRIQVYINGVQVSNGMTEWNTAYQVEEECRMFP